MREHCECNTHVDGVAYRRDILAGSRPGTRGTLVSAKAPKAICACAIARQIQRVPCTPCRLRGSWQGPFFAPAFPASLESPVRTVRGAPARRGGDSLDPRLSPARPCAWPGRAESLPRPFRPALRLSRRSARRKAPGKNTNTKNRYSPQCLALFTPHSSWITPWRWKFCCGSLRVLCDLCGELIQHGS